MTAEQVIPFIGKPWVSGARGPDAFDCWGLVYYVYRTFYGVELPAFPGVKEIGLREVVRVLGESTSGGKVWTPIDEPEHLCGVAMASGTRFHHVGLWLDLDGGLVFHSNEGRNVTAQGLRDVRLFGMNRIAFFRHTAFSHGKLPILQQPLCAD